MSDVSLPKKAPGVFLERLRARAAETSDVVPNDGGRGGDRSGRSTGQPRNKLRSGAVTSNVHRSQNVKKGFIARMNAAVAVLVYVVCSEPVVDIPHSHDGG